MKKYLALVCATMMCVCCLGLAACGGGSGQSSAASDAGSDSASASASDSAASEAASEAVDPSEEIIGTWKLAAMEYEGVTMAGDLSLMFGEDVEFTINFEEDGTGTFALDSESKDITWTDEGDGTFTVVGANFESDEPAEAVLDGEVLKVAAGSDSVDGAMVFTKSGESDLYKAIDLSDAEKITSESDLEGTYELTAVNMMGISMYGDKASLSNMMSSYSNGGDMSITFDGNGSVTLNGEEGQYVVSEEDGASIVENGSSYPIVLLDGDIALVDESEIAGDTVIMVFSK